MFCLQSSLSLIASAPGRSVYEEQSQAEMVSFPVYRILFCAVGRVGSREEHCFGFTCSRGEAEETAIFQCHVFKCVAAKAVSGFAAAVELVVY